MAELSERRIQIAVLDLRALKDRAPNRLDEWQRQLSLEEQARAGSFRVEGLRWDYVAAHVALRACLSRWLGNEEASIEFKPGSFERSGASARKPAIEPAAGMPDLRFNLTHTDGMVLIAAALGREIGVDVEMVRPLDDLEAMAYAVMSSVEHRQWVSLRDDLRLRAFYRVWSRKEAYLKAIGLGLYRELSAVTVPVGESVNEFRITDMRGDAEVWWGTSVEGLHLFGKRHEAAICWPGEGGPEISLEDCQLV